MKRYDEIQSSLQLKLQGFLEKEPYWKINKPLFNAQKEFAKKLLAQIDTLNRTSITCISCTHDINMKAIDLAYSSALKMIIEDFQIKIAKSKKTHTSRFWSDDVYFTLQ